MHFKVKSPYFWVMLNKNLNKKYLIIIQIYFFKLKRKNKFGQLIHAQQ